MKLTPDQLRGILKIKERVGVVDILNRLRNLSENDQNKLAHINPEFGGVKHLLFHGASIANKTLKPNKSQGLTGHEKQSLVYATDCPNYAIFMATLRLKNASAGVVANRNETTLTIDQSFVNGSSKLTKGFLHVLDARHFERSLPNREFAATRSVPVLLSIPVTPEDLTVPIFVQTS